MIGEQNENGLETNMSEKHEITNQEYIRFIPFVKKQLIWQLIGSILGIFLVLSLFFFPLFNIQLNFGKMEKEESDFYENWLLNNKEMSVEDFLVTSFTGVADASFSFGADISLYFYDGLSFDDIKIISLPILVSFGFCLFFLAQIIDTTKSLSKVNVVTQIFFNKAKTSILTLNGSSFSIGPALFLLSSFGFEAIFAALSNEVMTYFDWISGINYIWLFIILSEAFLLIVADTKSQKMLVNMEERIIREYHECSPDW